jgi:molybdenum cofactor cytidylyltransferase
MKTSKPLLNWGDEKLINFQISSLSSRNIQEIIVVLGSNAELIKKEINSTKVTTVVNVDFKLGKTTSIKKGLSAISKNKNDILLIAVDQPRSKLLLEQICDFHINHPDNKKITMPYFKGKSGHPIIFSNNYFSELLKINEETQGIREVIKRNQNLIMKYKTTDKSASIDMNTPQEYENSLFNYFK